MHDFLVAGGGLLGAHVARCLVAKGGRVTVASRSFNDLFEDPDLRQGPIELVRADLCDGKAVADLVEGRDVVFALAGSSTPAFAASSPAQSVASMLGPVVTLLEGMRRAGSQRVVVASSGGTVYGIPGACPTPEDHPTRPVSLHGAHAVALEHYASHYAERFDLQPTVLRFANLYGPGQHVRRAQGVIAAWMEALREDRPVPIFGDGSARRDFLFAADAAQATLRVALTAPGERVLNVGSGQAIALNDMLGILERVTGRAIVRDVHPARHVDVPVTQLDCTRLNAATGWQARTDPLSGLEETWAWVTRSTESRTIADLSARPG